MIESQKSHQCEFHLFLWILWKRFLWDSFSEKKQSSSRGQGAFPLSVESLTDDASPEISSGARVSCTEEVEELNNAPWLGSNEDLEYPDYLRSFYAITNFYDCNIRQQIQDDEVTESDSGLYTASYIGSIPADFTRFVSWIYRDNNAGEAVPYGRMVNLYLQENAVRTKTRIDLSYNGDKNVDSLFSSVSPNVPGVDGEYRHYTRVFFQEVSNDEGDVVEHRIAGRHYNNKQNDVIMVSAVVKLGVGSTIFVKICRDTNDLNFNCDISDASVKYFSAAGIKMDEPPAGMPTSVRDVGRRYVIGHFL